MEQLVNQLVQIFVKQVVEMDAKMIVVVVLVLVKIHVEIVAQQIVAMGANLNVRTVVEVNAQYALENVRQDVSQHA